MRNCIRGLSIALVLSITSSAVAAGVPRLITFQGRLTDSAGSPVADGGYSITFAIHTDSLAGTKLWEETQSATVSSGLFTVQLGTVASLADSIFELTPNLFVGMQIAGFGPPSARIRLTAGPFSYHALHADTADIALSSGGGAGGWVDDGTIVRLETITDNVGIGVTSSKSKLKVGGDVSADYYRIRDTVVLKYGGGRSLCVGGYAGTSPGIDECTFVGSDAARSGGGIANTGVGFAAGYNIEGENNVFVGHTAGYANELGQSNVFVGGRAGYAATGSGNVFIGPSAGYNETGNQKLYIANTSANPPLIYGDFSSGKIGLGTTAPAAKLDISDVVRITGGSMWPSAGEGLEFGYNPTLNRGFILAHDRTAGTWSKLFLGEGNVGIGMWDPTSKLSVSGGEGSVNVLLEADVLNIGEGNQPSITMKQDGGAVVGELGFFDASNDFSVVNRYAGCLNLGTSDSIAMMITSAGNVGIGVIAPANTHRVKVWSDATGLSNSTLLAQNGAASGAGGIALHAVSNATALYAVSNGTVGTAVSAIATSPSGVGIEATGGSSAYAAKFHGNVALYSMADAHLIMELGEGLDYAEGFDVSPESPVPPGTVLVIDSDHPGQLAVSHDPYDTRVAGIAAGAKGLGSGVRLGGDGFDVDVALAGRVYCNVDATEEEIEPGDLLTTSGTPGFAMKVTDHAKARGAILGKAMEPLGKGQKGQILVLVTLQ